MRLDEIIAELTCAAQQAATGLHVLEIASFDTGTVRAAANCLAAAKRRAEALSMAATLLSGAPGYCPNHRLRRSLVDCRSGARGALQEMQGLVDGSVPPDPAAEKSVLGVFFKKPLRTFGSLSFETLMCEAPLPIDRVAVAIRGLLTRGLIEVIPSTGNAPARYSITLDGERQHFGSGRRP